QSSGVAWKVEPGSASPRLRLTVAYPSSRAARFRFGIMSNDLELLDQIVVGDHNVCRSADVRVNDTVIKIELRSIRLTVEGAVGEARARNADVAFTTAKTSVLGRRNRSNTRGQSQQLSEVSTIQRKIVDGLLGN